MRGRTSVAACAAAAGSMRPGPSVGPHPHTGSNATSMRPASAAMHVVDVGVTREVHGRGPRTSKPIASAITPALGPGKRRPSWIAVTARTRRAADGRLLADGQFAYTREPEPLEERRSAPSRHVHRDRPVEAAAGTGRRGGRGAGARPRTASRSAVAAGSGDGPWRRQVRDAIAQEWIGEQARSADLEGHGGVAEPGESLVGGHVRDRPLALRGDRVHHPRG